MDYLYGKLNKLVERQEYKGLTTDTTEVTVDNANNTIAVDVKYLPTYYEDLLGEIQTALSNLSNISNGEPEGSIQQKGSKALGENDTALGTGNITGVKGYYIQKVRFTSESTQLLIGDTQVNPIEVANTELVPSSSFTAPLWDVGDEVCIVAHYHYDFCAKITSIQNNLITLDKNLDGGYIGKVVAELNKEDNAIYVPTKPEAGIISLLHSAASTGFDNKAVGKASFVSGAHNLAAGDYSHVEGRDNEAAYCSHAEGWKTSARGEYAHTEGIGTSTTADCAHAEGQETKATKRAAHAEGHKTTASGVASHAEGRSTEASGNYSHTEGTSTKASGPCSHAEGDMTVASEFCSHAEGFMTQASGSSSHAEGYDTVASGSHSHAEGYATIASGSESHAEGNKTKASGSYSHAEGGHDTSYTGEYGATASYTHSEGLDTLASAQGSHAEGLQSVASGEYSHAEGQSNATAWQSHAENNSTASGEQSHAEGAATASGKLSHAENGGEAYGERSHAEGSGRTGQATGDAGAWEAHAEGAGVALGVQSHAEGNGTVASGEQSHVEGKDNTASGRASHAQGIGNTATAEGQFVAGRYSKEKQNGLSSEQPDNELIVRIGAGQSAANPWTVFSIDNNGTTCMSSAGVITGGIVAPWNVINREYADNRYLGKSGGTVSGNVTIQGDLTVAGTTTTETEKQLLVEANVIATNANKQPLGALLSGLAINKNANDTYGLMYDPVADSVKFGQGTLDANNQFVFSANEGHPIAIRDDSEKFTDGHFVKWKASSNSFVDAGVDNDTFVTKSMLNLLTLSPSGAEYNTTNGIKCNGTYSLTTSDGDSYTSGFNSTWPIYSGSGIDFLNENGKLRIYLDSEHSILFNNSNSMFTEGMYVPVLQNGNWAQTKATADATPDAIAKRDAAGNLKVGAPQNDSDATPKSFVVPKVTTANILYGTGDSGETKNIKYSTTPVASSIPVRTSTGTLQMADPTADKDGVNLEYLNSKLPTIGGSQDATQTPLSSITYTPEASIPTSAVEGVEYACTDFIAEDDLDSNLQTKINSALTQTTADERYVKKSERGGAKWVPYSYPECKECILMELKCNDAELGITSYLTTAYHEYGGYCIPLYGQGGAFIGLANTYEDINNHTYQVSSVLKLSTSGITNISSANQTVTATRMLVNE